MDSPEEQAFEADGLAKRRSIAMLYAALCIGGLIVWSVTLLPGVGVVSWFGSGSLGWVFIFGIAGLLLYGVAGYAWEARRLTSRIRALRSSRIELAHARVHRG